MITVQLTPMQAELIWIEFDRVASESDTPSYRRQAAAIAKRLRRALNEAGGVDIKKMTVRR